MSYTEIIKNWCATAIRVAAAEVLEAGGALLTAMTFAQGLNEKLLKHERPHQHRELPLFVRLLPREFEAERKVRA